MRRERLRGVLVTIGMLASWGAPVHLTAQDAVARAMAGTWREHWGTPGQTDVTYHDEYRIALGKGNVLTVAILNRNQVVEDVALADGRLTFVHHTDAFGVRYALELQDGGQALVGTATTPRGVYDIRWERLGGEVTTEVSPAGVWRNPVSNTNHTVAARDGGYAVVAIVDQDDGEVYDIISSEWRDGVLRWSYYVATTGYTVHYETTAMSANRMDIRWNNEHQEGGRIQRRSGTRTLERVGGRPAAPTGAGKGVGATRTPAGVWRNPVANTDHTVVARDGGYAVVSVVDQDDGEVYDVLSSEWRDGVLRWSYYVATTGYTVHYQTTAIVANSMDIRWNNEHQEGGRVQRGSGARTLARVGGRPAASTRVGKGAGATPTPAGVWYNPGTHDRVTVVESDGGYAVVSVVDQDNRASHDILASEWRDGVLRWSYYVRSTGYTVHWETVTISANSMHVRWNNEHQEGGQIRRRDGTRTLTRVSGGTNR